MTPDEMSTRIFKQQAKMNAICMAMDALMVALPKKEQELWLKVLRSLGANEAAVLEQHGASAIAIAEQVAAVEFQVQRLEIARAALKRTDGK